MVLDITGNLSERIRSYTPHDRESIRTICCNTGFLGRPIDPIYHDRELFADALVNPYLDHEPGHAFVAEWGNDVVGYVLGSTDSHFELKALPKVAKTVMKMTWRALNGSYSSHPRSKQFVQWVLSCFPFERPKHPKNAAHLHANIARERVGKDLGLRLLTAYEEMLRKEGVPTYYGEVFSTDQRRTEALYQRLGFDIFDKRETTIFQPEIKDTLYFMCIMKSLR